MSKTTWFFFLYDQLSQRCYFPFIKVTYTFITSRFSTPASLYISRIPCISLTTFSFLFLCDSLFWQIGAIYILKSPEKKKKKKQVRNKCFQIIIKRGLKFSMRENQNVFDCIALQEMGTKLKTQFGFAAEMCTK